MIEAPMSARTREAIHAAHVARGETLKELWRWLKGSGISR